MDRIISAETGAALSLEQLKRAYDAEVRNFLSEKQILSDEFHIPMTETIDRRMSGMCNFSDGIEQDAMEEGFRKGIEQGMQQGRQEGRVEGRAEGRQEGVLNTLYSLVQKQILSVSDAAAEADQSVGEFQTGMDRWAAAVK